jgi:AcrR family transcriptional regulator
MSGAKQKTKSRTTQQRSSAPTKKQSKPPRTKGARPNQKFATPKSRETYERILDAAVDCFVNIGYHRSNMSKIAETARVTRSRIQYYFSSTEHLLTDAARHLLMKVWGRYQNQIASLRPGQPRLEIALEEFLNLRNDRYYVAWMELVAASRTEPELRLIIEQAQVELDRHAVNTRNLVLPNDIQENTALVETIADLTRLFLEGLTISVIPVDYDRRTANLLKLIRHAVLSLWEDDRIADLQLAPPVVGDKAGE